MGIQPINRDAIAHTITKTTAWEVQAKPSKGVFVGPLMGAPWFRIGSKNPPTILFWDKMRHCEVEVTLDALISACQVL